MDQSVQARGRVQWVDRARALSIILVVLLHARIELGFLDVQSPYVEELVGFASTMRMPLFFAAAGIFAVSWVERRSWRELMGSKLTLLLWVFLVWQPVVFAYKLVEMLLLPSQPDNTLVTQLAKLVLSPVRPNGELWFLWALALFFVVAKLTSRWPTWARVGVPAVVSVFWMSIGPLLPDQVLRVIGDGWEGALKYYFFFAAAVVFSPRLMRFFSGAGAATLAAILIVWLGVGALFVTDVLEPDLPGVRFLLCVLGVVGGFALSRLLAWVPGMDRLGANTLPVYVAHIPIIVAVVVPLYLAGFAPVLAAVPEVSVITLTAAAIAGAWWLHVLLIKTPGGRLMYAPPARVVAWVGGRRKQPSLRSVER